MLIFGSGATRGGGQKVLDALNQKHRKRQGKATDPTYGIIDSQSAKTQYHADERGIDGGKKGKGA